MPDLGDQIGGQSWQGIAHLDDGAERGLAVALIIASKSPR